MRSHHITPDLFFISLCVVLCDVFILFLVVDAIALFFFGFLHIFSDLIFRHLSLLVMLCVKRRKEKFFKLDILIFDVIRFLASLMNTWRLF